MLPQSLLLLLAATSFTLAASSPKRLSPAEQRALAFNDQKPLHTTALLAGAAATPIVKKHQRRVRDLRSVTGEDGLWVHFDDIRREEIEHDTEEDDGEEADEEMYGRKVKEQIALINRREGWEEQAGDG
ncbi:hypothetical protein P7C71_g3327, partial [Lecanoromycetidae sp. Uapishka_2]